MQTRHVILNSLLTFALFIGSFCHAKAQLRLGAEAGATISSIVSIPATTLYTPRVGVRAGAFLENDFTSFFALRTGVFYSLKGGKAITNDLSFWNLHCLTIPLVATFSPIKPLRLGIGLETSFFVANNNMFMQTPPVALGARAEVAWQINNLFRLIGHFTYDFTSILEIYYVDGNGYPVNNSQPTPYNCLEGGISLACTIVTFEKKK